MQNFVILLYDIRKIANKKRN